MTFRNRELQTQRLFEYYEHTELFKKIENTHDLKVESALAFLTFP